MRQPFIIYNIAMTETTYELDPELELESQQLADYEDRLRREEELFEKSWLTRWERDEVQYLARQHKQEQSDSESLPF